MAARKRFPYSATAAPDGRGVMAETANGRHLRFTGPAGVKAQQMAAAQAALAPAPAPAITDDAHQFNVLAEAADALHSSSTARGGVRDLAPADVEPMSDQDKKTVEAEFGMATEGRFPARPPPTLAETQETRAYTGAAPAGAGWDTVYEDPAERERREAARAAALQARVKHAADVSFYDPEQPIPL